MATSCPAGLLPNSPLPDTDDVVRYCSPIRYDLKNERPKAGAFIDARTPGELSVNHLQHYQGLSKPHALDRVRDEVDSYLTLKPNGRFLIFNVGAVKRQASQKGMGLSVFYSPECNRPSHSSIYLQVEDDVEKLATMLMRMTTQATTYPAVI